MKHVRHFVSIHCKEIDRDSIPVTKKTRVWCQLPYPGHPKGCPNFGKNEACPPRATILNKDEYEHFYLIYAEFDFGKYKDEKRMDPKHQDDTEKQLGNSRHWQGAIKAMLKDKIKKLYKINSGQQIYVLGSGSGFTDKEMKQIQDEIYSMEAAGVYVFGIFKNESIPFELKPKDRIVISGLICSHTPLLLNRVTMDQFMH